jgi:DNA-binding response OmpR family regulator
MSGYETCEQIRQTYSAAELPIIMMMTMCVSEEIIHCFKSGANDYLPKPFIGQELVARIEARLRLRRLELRSKSILSKVEVEILRYYNSNPGTTRRAIVDLMNLEREHPIVEKTLANHITSILRKTTASRMNEAVTVAKRNSWI